MRSGSGFTVPSVFMDSLPAAAGSTFAGASAVDLLGESNMSSAQLPDCPAPDVTSDAVMKRPASLRAQNEVSSTPGRRGWERPPEIGASGLLLPAAPGHTAIASPHSSWLSVSPSSSSGSLAQHLARSSLQAEGAPDAVKGSKPQAISSPGFVHQPLTPEDSPTPAAGEGTTVAHERRARSARMPDEGTAAHTPRQRMLQPRQPTHKASLSLPELSVPDSLISSPPGTPRLAAISPRAAATHGGGAASGALSRIASPEPVQTPERGSQFGATSDQFGAGSPSTPAASTTTGSPQAPAPRTPPQAADAPAPGSPPSAKAIFDGARPTPPPSSPHYSAASAVPHSFPPPPRGSPQIPPPPWMSGHASSAYAAGAPLSGDRPPLAQSPKSPVSRPCSTTSQYTTCASHLDESDVGSAGRSSGSNSCVGPRTRLNRRSQLLADGTARAHSRTLAHSNGQNVTADALRPPDPQNMSRAWSNPVFLDVTAPEVAPPVPGRALPMRPQTALGEAHSSDEFWSGRQVDPLPLIPSGEAALRAALPQHSPRLLLSPRPAGAPPTPPNEDACSASTDSSGSLSSLPSGVAPAHARRGSVSSSAAASAAPGSGEADPTVALPGDLPDMLQSFLGRLDTVEKNLHADWESEQHAREAELLRLQHGSARRPAAGDFGVALDVYGVSGPLSNPDDIVADSRSGMRTSRAHFCSPSLTSPHFLVPARDYPSADRVLAASYEAPFTMADAAPDFLRHARSLTPRSAGGAAARELAAAASHVATLERLVTDKMEPIARHIAGMKRRMVSAQEEAQLLREELESAQRSQHTLSSASAGESEVAELASHTAAKAALVKAADEVSALMEQVSALEGECEALQQELSASRVRESALQTLVDTQQPGDQLVAFDAHMAVVHENASLKAQIEQLKQDLEFLYMDHNFLTHHGTSGGAGGSGGELAQMTTAARLASLLAPSEMRTSGSHMSFARSMTGRTSSQVPKPSSSLGQSGSLGKESNAKPGALSVSPGISRRSSYAATPPKSPLSHAGSMLQPSGAAVLRELDGASGPMSEGPIHGDYLVPTNQELHFSRNYFATSPTVTKALATRPPDALAQTVQKQAAALADKDAEIAKLKQQLKQVTPLLPTAPRSSAASSPKPPRAADSGPSSPAAQKRSSVVADGTSRDVFSGALMQEATSRRLDEDADWQNLPVPESLQEALEQILVLQMSNNKLRDALEGVLEDGGGGGGERPHVDGEDEASPLATPMSRASRAANGKARPPAGTLRETLTQARHIYRDMAAMKTLATAMTSVRGDGRSMAMPPAGDAASGQLPAGPLADMEMEVFRDMVLRELSDTVVTWQEAHGEVSRELVAQKMRAAELQTEHDKLIAMIKDLMAKERQHKEAAEQLQATLSRKSSSRLRSARSLVKGQGLGGDKKDGPAAGKSKIGFLGRLKTPRNRD